MVKSQHYQHIWDCCCDHGLLGFSLLSPQKRNDTQISNSTNTTTKPTETITNTKVHFVDIVPELMLEIDNKLKRFYPATSLAKNNTLDWQTHCLDVAQLPLKQYQGKHLVIIAGVGGDLMIKFIEAINQQHSDLAIDFLLCPVHHQYALRSKLIELKFSLIDECLVAENQRFYELMLVSSEQDNNNKITKVGDKFWLPLINKQPSQQADIATKYLKKTLQHYQRIQKGIVLSAKQSSALSSGNNPINEQTVAIQNTINAYQDIAKRTI